MDKETKRFMLNLRGELDRAGDMHRLNMAYGCPHNMTHERWSELIDDEAKRISDQWEMWRKLWKQHGGGNDYRWPL